MQGIRPQILVTTPVVLVRLTNADVITALAVKKPVLLTVLVMAGAVTCNVLAVVILQGVELSGKLVVEYPA